MKSQIIDDDELEEDDSDYSDDSDYGPSSKAKKHRKTSSVIMDDEDDDGTAEEQDEAENDSEHEYDDSYSYSHGRSAQDKNKDSVDELFGWSLFSVPSALASSYQFTSAWPWPNNTVAIEKVLDHRPIPGYHSKLNQSKQYRPLLDEIKDIDAFEYLLKLEGVAYVHARWTRTDGRLSQTQQKAVIDDEMSENSSSFAAATHLNHQRGLFTGDTSVQFLVVTSKDVSVEVLLVWSHVHP